MESRGVKMKHPRLDELRTDFGWTNERPFSGEHGSGVQPMNGEVRATIDGRTVDFFHWPYRRLGYAWGCGAHWSEGMRRRQRKQAKKRTAELVSLVLEPSERRVLESAPHPSQIGVEDRFVPGTAGLFYGLAGDPPPAAQIIAMVEVLAKLATRIEAALDASS